MADAPAPATAAALIVGMSNRLVLRCRNLEAGFAASMVYETWKDICVKTEAWRTTQKFTFVQWQKEFVLTPAFNVTVRRIVKVIDRGLPLVGGIGYWFVPPLTIKIRSPEMSTSVPSTEPWNSGTYPWGEVFFVKYVMDPIADDPSGIDTDLFTAWDNTIYNGCMASLLEMSNMQWYDKAGVQQKKHKSSYEKDLGMIRMDADRPGGKTDEMSRMTPAYPFIGGSYVENAEGGLGWA